MEKLSLPRLVLNLAERKIADKIEATRKTRQELEAQLATASLELLTLEDQLTEDRCENFPQSPVVVEIRTTDTYEFDEGYVMSVREKRPTKYYTITCSDLDVAYIASIALDPAPPEWAIQSQSIRRNVVRAQCGELGVAIKPDELVEDKQLTRNVVIEKVRDVAKSLESVKKAILPREVPIVMQGLLRQALLQYCHDTDSTFTIHE